MRRRSEQRCFHDGLPRDLPATFQLREMGGCIWKEGVVSSRDMPAFSDPFREARETSGVMKCPFRGEEITMILGHEAVRTAARDWQTFSSDAPFRVPIPSEESVRGMRQLPIETDPPLHAEYRELVEPFFQRAKQPEVMRKMEELIATLVSATLENGEVEVVHEFALPLQSRALTYLLNVPEREAETWIGWGVHVFRQGDGFKKGVSLDDYLMQKFDAAETAMGDDFFSALTRAELHGRPLMRDEMMGFANLAFAGGRDTVIHTISCALGYLAEHPEKLEFLREDPKRITLASEEFFRVFMPLTHIGRVCPVEAEVQGETVGAGQRVSLCWSSANFDASVFSEPEQVKLDRKPNPHVSFGFAHHLCLGAPHARLILRTLLHEICRQVKSLEIVSAEERVEREAKFSRTLGYESLHLKFKPIS